MTTNHVVRGSNPLECTIFAPFFVKNPLNFFRLMTSGLASFTIELMKTGLIIKLAFMMGALFVVVYAIRSLNSVKTQPSVSDPNSFVGLLLGGDQRLLNWCPAGVSKVEILSLSGAVQKTVSSAADVSSLCELMVGGFVQSEQQPTYSARLRAYGKDPQEIRELEGADRESLFKYQGMPFSCPGLVRALERLESK